MVMDRYELKTFLANSEDGALVKYEDVPAMLSCRVHSPGHDCMVELPLVCGKHPCEIDTGNATLNRS
jgi:hypothetical protein